jgi:hypothetical protein
MHQLDEPTGGKAIFEKEHLRRNKKGHAQHIAFVLQFGKFCGLNRMFLNGDLR